MTQRTHGRLLVAFTLYVAALLSIPSPARAEDTDIFFINPSYGESRPNVLIVLDNSANWDQTDQGANDGTKRFENVRKALQDTVTGLTDQFNVGIMLYDEPSEVGERGGVVRAGVRQLTSTYKPLFADMVGNLQGSDDKAAGPSASLTFYEAYLYFKGATAFAGHTKTKRDYAVNNLPTSGATRFDNPSLAKSNAVWAKPTNAFSSASSSQYVSPVSDVCQKNFIIFISNNFTNDPTPVKAAATQGLETAGGSTSMITLSPNGMQDNPADEWARFLSIDDPVTYPGKPTVISYAVEVNPITTGGGPDWTALMKSVATQGKGKYFGVSSASGGAQITEALNKIFAEVLAVNSVFASATLPVSVNVRGTYLNQVYMGVFRPDANASPRWPGNVKQYTLALTVDKNLVLVGKDGQTIENASTGFVSPSARSYWTKDETPGFWDLAYYPEVQAISPLAASPKDLPDGEFVEKGGAAQHLRIDHATDVTTRNLYTCLTGLCAFGDSLKASANNAFTDANANITSLMLGITGQKSVSKIERKGNTAYATSTAHGFTQNQVVQIRGALPNDYNVTANVFVDSSIPDEFTYTVNERPVSPATAATGQTMKATKGSGTPVTVISLTRGTTAANNTATVTVKTSSPHGFIVKDSVTISGSVPATSEYYNAFEVATIVSDTEFTFLITTAPGATTQLGSVTVTRSNGTQVTQAISNISRAGTLVTVTASSNVFTGSLDCTSVTLSNTNAPAPYDNIVGRSCTKTSNSTLTFSLTDGTEVTPALSLSGTYTATPGLTRNISSMTRALGSSTVTVTTEVAHGFSGGNSITISGASDSLFNGVKEIATSGPTSTQFTFTVTPQPTSPATTITGITATGGANVDRTELIRWVRGENRRSDDNPVNTNTRVRGYIHGDVLHSRPAVVNYNRTGQTADRDIGIFYGSNDGVIHAVKGGQDDADGNELWGFIPEEFMGRFVRQYNADPIISTANRRTYFADGPISVDTVYNKIGTPAVERLEGTGARAQIFVGMRRGGRFYYSLDVTDPATPILKWKISNDTPGFNELGQSWSEMKVVTIKTKYGAVDPDVPEKRRVLVFGAGYDPGALDSVTAGAATMGRGVYIVDAVSGALIWHAGPFAPKILPSGATFKEVSGMTAAIPADIAVIDSDFDLDPIADRAYAADAGGNIWRINISDPDPANWTVGHVASLAGSADVDKRRFLFAPDIVPFDATTDSILIGSGDREQPFDATIANRFYMIKDAHALNAQPGSTATEANLCDLTSSSVLVDADRTCLATSKGWMIRLLGVDPSTGVARGGEKGVTGATTLGGVVIFATNTPRAVNQVGSCAGNLGTALIYAISFKDATPQVYGIVGNAATARSSVRPGGGFPPTPIPVAIRLDGKDYYGAITGTQVINPTLINPGQRYRVFWNLSVDN